MSRLLGILFVLVVVILAMAFAAANAGHRVTLDLGILVLYRAPVTLVAFLGLLAGMLVMFAAGIHTDLKVRRILRERLAEEARQEQGWIDRNQRDLFAQEPEPEDEGAPGPGPLPAVPVEPRMTPPPEDEATSSPAPPPAVPVEPRMTSSPEDEGAPGPGLPPASPVEPRMTPPPEAEAGGGGTETKKGGEAEGAGVEEPAPGPMSVLPDEEERPPR